ncbi:hypothetical protein EI94DRAFT_886840 [Lactarius quietus]|nr:hypothetical protein EI94DRAFT_886840 [Lactarius quietus]
MTGMNHIIWHDLEGQIIRVIRHSHSKFNSQHPSRAFSLVEQISTSSPLASHYYQALPATLSCLHMLHYQGLSLRGCTLRSRARKRIQTSPNDGIRNATPPDSYEWVRAFRVCCRWTVATWRVTKCQRQRKTGAPLVDIRRLTMPFKFISGWRTPLWS